MTPDERREVVAMLRDDAAHNAERGNLWNGDTGDHEPNQIARETAWMHMERANLLALAANEIEKGTTDAR